MSSKKELASILEGKVKEEELYICLAKDDRNPQIKELVIRAEERKNVYEGILYYLKTGMKGLI